MLKHIGLIRSIKVKLNTVTRLYAWNNVEKEAVNELSQPIPCISP